METLARPHVDTQSIFNEFTQYLIGNNLVIGTPGVYMGEGITSAFTPSNPHEIINQFLSQRSMNYPTVS